MTALPSDSALTVGRSHHADHHDTIVAACAREMSKIQSLDAQAASRSRRIQSMRKIVATSIAESQLDRAIDLWTLPPDPGPIELLIDGILIHHGGDPDRALQQFRIAGHTAPVDWKPLALQGWVQEQSGRQRQAMQLYRHAMTLDRSNQVSTLALSRLLVRFGRLPASIGLLQKALARDQRSPAINRELALLYERRASNNQKRGRTEVRLHFLRKALDHYQITFEASGDTSSRVAQAMVLRQMGEHESSKQMLQQLVDQRADSKHESVHWARTLLAFGKAGCW